MTHTDKIFYAFMSVMTMAILLLLFSILGGCAASTAARPAPLVDCEPVGLPDKAMDPCELEYWEDQEFAKYTSRIELSGD